MSINIRMSIKWSETKCANFIKQKFGIPTPIALSYRGWDEYEEKYGNHIVMRFFDGLDKIQAILFYPKKLYDSIFYYLRNRFVRKTHFLKTNLEVGKYHNFDDRVLHGLFNEFVNYIEIEKSYVRRSLEKDMETFKWEIEQCDNERQSEQARWELDAYNWWLYERPNRPDPYDESGLSGNYKENGNKGEPFDNELWSEMDKKCDELIESYYKEDTKWMIELIERRSNI